MLIMILQPLNCLFSERQAPRFLDEGGLVVDLGVEDFVRESMKYGELVEDEFVIKRKLQYRAGCALTSMPYIVPHADGYMQAIPRFEVTWNGNLNAEILEENIFEVRLTVNDKKTTRFFFTTNDDLLHVRRQNEDGTIYFRLHRKQKEEAYQEEISKLFVTGNVGIKEQDSIVVRFCNIGPLTRLRVAGVILISYPLKSE